eukprot:CAMPEP_0177262530 /NCGR_PEP_ID=MMETSP0367-20130122/60450_1 /TAXON_ID=447022 ORGANISM="Scrippsiella hangoei-like, Strain SHHI-4" /NCGR_SAMPLE_ID=MMETSP0367 /ASSEMBLY_ACC=CAM_ASM_000362 /LENGTH=54 /DNA_ID=CAMNT_0018717339 /DNA_START=13 /DNA_END=177 /DNA_ORIENTATION=+
MLTSTASPAKTSGAASAQMSPPKGTSAKSRSSAWKSGNAAARQRTWSSTRPSLS